MGRKKKKSTGGGSTSHTSGAHGQAPQAANTATPGEETAQSTSPAVPVVLKQRVPNLYWGAVSTQALSSSCPRFVGLPPTSCLPGSSSDDSLRWGDPHPNALRANMSQRATPRTTHTYTGAGGCYTDSHRWLRLVCCAIHACKGSSARAALPGALRTAAAC